MAYQEIPASSATGSDMLSLYNATAAQFIPAGFSTFYDDLFQLGRTVTAAATSNPNTQNIIQANRASGVIKMSSLAGVHATTIYPNMDTGSFTTSDVATAPAVVPVVGNPSTEPWTLEARMMFPDQPVSGMTGIGLFGPVAGVGGGTISDNLVFCRFVFIGFLGTNKTAGTVVAGSGSGSQSFLTFLTWDATTLRAQTTTVDLTQFTGTMHALGLATRGDGTIYATVDGALTGWSTTNLTGVPSVGCFPTAVLMGSAATAFTSLVDYIAASGKRT